MLNTMRLGLFGIALGAIFAAACGAPSTVSTKQSAAQDETESDRLNAWLDREFERSLTRSPITQTYLGRRTDYDKWDNVSNAFAVETHALDMTALAEMKREFDIEKLDEQAKLSYRLFDYSAAQSDEAFAWRKHSYVFSQLEGPHADAPAFLINQHSIANLTEAEAYIARLEGMKDYLGQHEKNARERFAMGVYPPKWSHEQMIGTARNIIAGAPFDDGAAPSSLLADFTGKIDGLDIEAQTKADLRARAEAALINSVKPAYEALIDMFEEQQAIASNDDGAWKLPEGDAYYQSRLDYYTTTSMSADEIHALGLTEVARIHHEMKAIMDAVGYEGTLQEFFGYLRDDPDGKFYYPNTDQGRQTYLDEATALIDALGARLDELFYTKPKADLIVKRVEPFRERAAGKAFYEAPAPDGSRPGVYYANLYDMSAMPRYQMAALAYHEGVPGHHMQIAIAQELEDVPLFRKFGGYTAYVEGWGLYSEYIPKEMGFYDDPYSDFGRLAMELWRAARLVVDTGIHDKKWTREETIDYLIANTPNPRLDIERSTERYIVLPGQATAYKIGMIKIQTLRERARQDLGEAFDLRAFHDTTLTSGPLPLEILEENIDVWIAAQRQAPGASGE